LRQVLYLFLYLNIYTCIFTKIKAQALNLSFHPVTPINNALKDSLNFNSHFDNYQLLKQTADSIPDKLQQLGFVESELINIEMKNDSSFIAHYKLGMRYKYIKIYYADNQFLKKEIAKISNDITNDYFILPFNHIEASLQKLNNLKTNNGNAFAKIQLVGISNENNFLTGTIVLNAGQARRIDSITIKGYENFPKSYLKHYAGIKKETLFNEKKINAQSDALNSLPFSSSIKAPEALFRKDSTIVYLYLKKRVANIFDGVLGFNTSEQTNKLQLNGYLNLELINNLNYGERLLINYKADGQEQRKLRVNTSLPYLFGTPIGAELELKIFRRDSTFITTDQQIRINYQLNPSYSSYMGYKGYESSNLLDNAITGSPIEDFNSSFFLLGFNFFRLQNNTLFPTKAEIFFNSEIGSRELQGTKDNQLKLLTKVNFILNLNYKNSIFIQNTSNMLLSDSFITNELFRFGGITSIRGFDENSIDASLFSIFNTEYRYQFNEGIYIHSILDFGYFENEPLSIRERIYGYGIGLGLQTKAGLFKLNIANGNTENMPFNFSNTKIHLILSTRF
jgi:outer membrane protein assembly factor BamA